METKKTDFIIIALITISILLLILPFIASYFFRITPEILDNPTPIGDIVGKLMNPFIALAGVFITFLAFYMQLKANQIQITFFNANQTEQNKLLKEQMFFRLVDNLSQRIANFSHTETQNNKFGNPDKTEFLSYKALDNIIKRFFYKIDYKCIALGRQLLASIPEQLEESHYFKILQSSTRDTTYPSKESVEDLKKSIIDIKTYNERWEFIKFYIGSTDSKNENQKDALKSIGHVQFYKIDFNQKESLYISSYDEIYKEYGGFMDGYLKNFTYLINFIDNSENNDFFIDYLKSNISTQELILIFYFCASRKSTQTFRNQIKKNGLLDNLHIGRDRFVDLPSEEELNKEIDNILKVSSNR